MKKLLLFPLVLLLAACHGLTAAEPPPTLYMLNAETTQPVADKTGFGVLTIEDPILAAGLDSDRIALFLNNGRQLDYYAGARWPVSLGHMIQDVTTETGHRALPGLVIGTPDLNIAADYRLEIRVTDFAPVYQGSAAGMPLLRETIGFTLVRLPEGTVVTDFTLADEKPAASNDLTAVTGGLEKLLQGILQQGFQEVAGSIALSSAPAGQNQQQAQP